MPTHRSLSCGSGTGLTAALTASDALAKAYTALNRLVGLGDDSAVIILYTLQQEREAAEAVLQDFVASHASAIEKTLQQVRDGRISEPDLRPLVAHVMYRFDVGGLEKNGVVNLINHMPRDAYRHAIISLTEITDFRKRIKRDDVQFIALNKQPGHAAWIYPQLYRLFAELKPAIVHTRNLGALELAIPAWAAGVPERIHGEHGRDVGDLDGTRKKFQWVRRLYRPFVTYYIALSRDLEQYLTHVVGMAGSRVAQIYNGVDAERFSPASQRQPIEGCPFADANEWLIGTVGRMQTVKNQTDLAKAFVLALQIEPELQQTLRLTLLGDGPLRNESMAVLEQAGCVDKAWLPGERNDDCRIFCAVWIVSFCPHWPKGFRTPSSKPWHADCR